MATNRKDLKVTRLDLRIPNDIYSQVEEIARANNEPSHHITGNIILSPTLLKLISLGIRSLSGNYAELADIPTNIGRVPDTLSPRVDAIEGELADLKRLVIELSDKLSGQVSDKNMLVPDSIPDELSDSNLVLADMNADTLSDNSDILSDDVTDKLSDSSTPSITTTSKMRTVEGDSKTWVDFFKMVGIEALTATEAQKKENINIRTEQIAEGLQAAREKGLGAWAVKVAGRSFVRVIN
jgi:hypothetical protein